MTGVGYRYPPQPPPPPVKCSRCGRECKRYWVFVASVHPMRTEVVCVSYTDGMLNVERERR